MSFRNYTSRIIRAKAAEKLGIEIEGLETPEMKESLNNVIEDYLESISKEKPNVVHEQSNAEEDYSETDSVIPDELDEDEEPVNSVPVKRDKKESKEKKQKVTVTKTEKPAKRTKKAVKAENTLDKLKSYVFKCGVRKIWKRELDGLDETASIAKVRGILEELGMEGRPSLEKCKKIKDQREFAEEMKIIDESKILRTRLRGQRIMVPEENIRHEERRIVPRLNLSAFGDSESE